MQITPELLDELEELADDRLDDEELERLEDEDLEELLDEDRLLAPLGGGKKNGIPTSTSGIWGARFQRR